MLGGENIELSGGGTLDGAGQVSASPSDSGDSFSTHIAYVLVLGLV